MDEIEYKNYLHKLKNVAQVLLVAQRAIDKATEELDHLFDEVEKPQEET